MYGKHPLTKLLAKLHAPFESDPGPSIQLSIPPSTFPVLADSPIPPCILRILRTNSLNLPTDMAETPHWAWNNLGNGLAGNEVAEVQILFFEGRAPIDIYRAIYYGAAGK